MKVSLVEKNGMYYAVFRLPDTKKQVWRTTKIQAKAGNKRKAMLKAEEIAESFDDVKTDDKAQMQLQEYIAYWIEREKVRLSATTYDNYISMLNKHIKPYFEKINVPMRDLKPSHLQSYVNEKVKEVSATTVGKHIGLIKPALQDALINGYVKRNVAYLVKLPKKEKPKHDFYTTRELVTLLNVIKGTVLEVPVTIAVLFGLRRSEVIGLKWSDIDLKEGLLTVNGTVTRQKQADGRIIDVYEEKTKTQASKDCYYLNGSLIGYFSKLKEHNMQIISNTDDYKEFVCVNAIGERLKLDYVTDKFSSILRQNGLRHIRFHDLRHSCLSLLANDGAFSMKQVQGYARHSNFEITADTYCHNDREMTRTELDCICSALGIKD